MKKSVSVLGVFLLAFLLVLLCPRKAYAADWKILEDDYGVSYYVDVDTKSETYSAEKTYISGYYYNYSTGWQKVNGKWYYFDASGYMIKDQIIEIDSKSYYFAVNGVMKTGWIKQTYDFDEDYVEWYYAKSSGVLASGWTKVNNKWYYFNTNDYTMISSSFIELDGKLYYFDDTGAMKTGWVKDHYEYGEDDSYTYWYYADSSGAMVTGWNKIDGKWYLFDTETCCMYADQFYVSGGKEYYFGVNGAMKTGLFEVRYEYDDYSIWCYADSNGVLQSGWKKINNKWYYFDKDTKFMIQDDSYLINGKSYLFNEDGSLVSKAGWIRLGDLWYYANSDGTAYIGWKKIDGSWYYLRPDYGIMATSACVIDGVLYTFNASGVNTGKVTKTGWYQNPKTGYYYYIKSDGTGAVGWEKINGKWYYFASSGAMVTGSWYIEEENKTYFFNEKGALASAGWQSESYEDGGKFWYYTNDKGVCLTGWQKINNKWYYFDPDYAYMYSGGTYFIDGKDYYFDDNGVYQS